MGKRKAKHKVKKVKPEVISPVVKWFGVFLVILLVANIILMITGKISEGWFWVIVAIVAAISYWGIPKLKTML